MLCLQLGSGGWTQRRSHNTTQPNRITHARTQPSQPNPESDNWSTTQQTKNTKAQCSQVKSWGTADALTGQGETEGRYFGSKNHLFSAKATRGGENDMVSRTQEAELNRLENQVDNGGGGAWEYLCLLQKLKLRRSDKVLKHGLPILNDPRKRSALGPEEWTLYEQLAIAAMDCQRLDVAKDCIMVLRKQFPESKRVGRLEGMLLEAKGSWAEAEKAYSSLLEDNPLDQIIYKRKVAMAKAQGNISSAIECLNKYLDIFMADHEAWRELAEIYVSLQMYKQAAFCYEELILAQPTVPLYHLAYADVLYTLGGLENLQTAKKYYASTIDLTGGKNTRALIGICLCTSALAQLSKGRNKEEKEGSELHSLAAIALEKEYKQRAPEKLDVLTSALRSLKV